MSEPPDSLTEKEIRQITALIETLDRSSLEYLLFEFNGLRVAIGKGELPADVSLSAPPSVASAAVAVPPQDLAGVKPAKAAAGADGTTPILSPMTGRFYSRPEPGTTPFVSAGVRVTPDMTVALIEIMKVFTAVKAQVSGVIVETCVQDSALVEYQEIIFRVRPDSP